ncbi:hypothetical protein NQ315_004473 [Exocentrus adspersus]|uniref:Tantalus-like domain-containing protein n=1 Tax=Exocentrus adspersus TaxID=1586481 RepID=A0AAV8VQU3_9CUCU|nr:hypothetical protein NQ315_004473 [Exocentrus adspersus]
MEQNELDVDMAQLEINEKKRISTGLLKHKVDKNNLPVSSADLPENEVPLRRSCRKKICNQVIEKRRVLMKPRKLSDVNVSMDEIYNYYLDKRVKRLTPSLETIFEEPKGNTFMSTRKFKRTINFANHALRVLQEKLSAIEDDDEEEIILEEEK